MANFQSDVEIDNLWNNEDNDKVVEEDYVILHTPEPMEWSGLIGKILLLPTTTSWNLLLIISIVLNYMMGVNYFFFSNQDIQEEYITYYALFDILYLCDVVIHIIHRYWKNFRQKMQLSCKSKTYLLIDIISLLPQELGINIIYQPFVKYCRFITYIRMYRIFQLFKQMLGSVTTHRLSIFLAQYFVMFFMILHTAVCIWCYLGCFYKNCAAKTWTSLIFEYSKSNEILNTLTLPEWYMFSGYICISFLTNAGFGDFYPVTALERFHCVLIMTCGYLLLIILIAMMTVLLINIDYRESKFFYEFRIIKKIIKDINLSDEIKNNLLKYYKVLWKSKNGIIKAEMLHTLPNPLKMELLYDINIMHLQHSILLKNLPEPILRKISLIIHPMFLLPGDILFHQDVVKLSMVFIANGILEILSEEDDESPIISFKTGTVLGEVSLLLTIPGKATVRAATFTELQVIERREFMKTMMDYPDAIIHLRNIIQDRVKIARESNLQLGSSYVIMNLLISDAKEYRPIKLLKDHLLKKKTTKGNEEADNLSALQDVPFNKDYLSLYRLSENVTMVLAPLICLTQTYPWILDPNSTLKIYWNIVINIVQILYCMMLPYFIVYERYIPEWLEMYGFVADMIYVVEIYVKCVTAVIVQNHPMLKLKKIVNYQLTKLTFYIDILSLFPIEVLYYSFPNVQPNLYQRYYQFCKLNRLLRIWRFEHFFKMIRNFFVSDMLFKLLKYTTYLYFTAFCAGALLYFQSCMYPICFENGWFSIKIMYAVYLKKEFPCYEYPVAISTYFGTIATFLVGYGDVVATSSIDSIIVSGLELFGFFIICYITAKLCASYSLSNYFLKQYQENVFSLKRFLDQKHIHRSLQSRITDFFKLQWYYDKGIGREALQSTAPPHLRSAIQGAELKNALEKIPLFQLIDADFLLLIAECAEVKILPSEEIVAYEGDVSREMNIILSGHCNILSDSKNVIHSCGPGEAFGVIEMLYGIPKHYTYQTITNCKIMSIHFRSFERITNMFPVIEEEMKEVMNDSDILNGIKNINIKNTDDSRIKEQNQHKKIFSAAMTRLSTNFVSSFIFTIRQCNRSRGKDVYWQPFRKLGKFHVLGYLLMPLTIHPRGIFLRIWCGIRVISIMVACMFGPYYLAVAPYADNISWIFILTDICSYIDIYLLFHLAYYNEKGILISHPQLTAANYLRKSFALDVIAVFPIQLIINADMNPYQLHQNVTRHIIKQVAYRSWHLNVVLQFHRIPELFHYLENDILKSSDLIKFCKFLPITLIIINLISSLVFGLNCNYNLSSKIFKNNTWDIIVQDRNETYHGYLNCSKRSWFNTSQYTSIKDPGGTYIIAVYLITDAITGIGLGNITPSDGINMYIIIFTVILGRLLFAYAFARLANGRSQLSSTQIMYQENLKDLNKFLDSESVDEHWKKKMNKYYLYVWKRTLGSNPQQLCKMLNASLMEDTVSYLYEKTLRDVPLFENVEKSFIRVITRYLVEEYFLKGDSIIKYQDIHNKIYIILRGKVEVLTSYNEMLACMGPGGLFGNICQINTGCSSVSIVASSNLDVLVISSEEFYTVLKDYPRIKSIMDAILKTVTDFIMPTTIIDNDVSSYESVDFSLDTINTDSSTIETMNQSVQNRLNSTITTSSTQPSYDLRRQHSFRTALYICLPWKWFQFVLLPDNIIFKITNILIVLISYYDFIAITYMFIMNSMNLPFLYITFGLESIFYFKILLHFHEAYPDKYGNYVMSSKIIARNYLTNKKRLFWDIVSNFPIEPFCYLFPLDTMLFALNCLRLLHILRIRYMKEYFYHTNKQLMSNKGTKQIFEVILWILLALHVLACIWLMITCPFHKCSSESPYPKIPTQMFNKPKRYLLALYYITSLGTSTGVGDIYPHTLLELFFTISVAITARFMTAVLIAEFIKVINVFLKSLSMYENKVQCLQDFLHNQNLSDHQMEKLQHYLKDFWEYDKGQHMPIMLTNCSYVLKCNIMNVLYGYHIRNCYLFNDLNEALLRQITVRLQRMVFFKGNYIVQHGDTDQNMYFIHRGEVTVLTVHANLTETQHELLKENDMFGLLQGIYHGLPHHFSFRANTKTSILVLNFDTWRYMLKYFSADEEIIYNRAQTLYVYI